MATITDRASAKTLATSGVPRVGIIRVSLGTMTEAVNAGNFGMKGLWTVQAVSSDIFGGSNGTFISAVVRNPGSEGARASVSMVRIRTDAGTAAYERKLAGTIAVDLIGFGF